MKKKYFLLLILGFLPFLCIESYNQTVSGNAGIDSGDTAWMLIATTLVLLMNIPGLALFYGGLVRQKNILSVLMQCFVVTSVITLEWLILGYSMVFSPGNWFSGGFEWVFLQNINITDPSPYFISHHVQLADGSVQGTIPHILFVLFQCMFAVITPALIVGAFAERVKFGGFLLFSILWSIVVYNPVAHWVWASDGWLFKLGVLDFAGGIVVHITAGIAALVMAIKVGRRQYYEDKPVPPHNIPLVAIGASLLWVGWFGFNAGSGLAADSLAVSAFLATHASASVAAFVWVLLEWIINKKPTTIGFATGAIAGLAAITPASGFVTLPSALMIGIVSSLACFYMVSHIKPKLGYDDSLDAFGVHGVAGIWGTLAVGLFASPAIQSAQHGLFAGNPRQFWIQLLAVVVTIGYTVIFTWGLFMLVDKTVGIRASSNEESAGLDLSEHSEEAYSDYD